MPKTWVPKLLFCAIFFCNSAANADQSKRLSQIAFDRSQQTHTDNFAAQNALPTENGNQEALIAAARASLIVAKLGDDLGSPNYITANLKGQNHDTNNPTQLSSTRKWRSQGPDCANPKDTEDLCSKARALGEILRRFSGRLDFLALIPAEPCANATDMRALTEIEIDKNAPILIAALNHDGQCSYRLQSKSQINKLLSFKVDSVQTTCLPASCFR
ncbi:hypothetical protein JNK13_07340 [bacterium]|nr:hypothetical protein [bacterium]